MWIVFNRQDYWEQGYSVANETEAREICDKDTELTYIYVGMATLTA